MASRGEAAPRVSVLMTTFNTGPVIQDTVDAILAQTFEDWELVIVDDCSSDDTVERLAGYSDQRIHVHRNATNQGISQTRNRAIALARGEYVAANDHDDLSLPSRLSHQVAYLDANPDVVLLATAAKELANGQLRSCYSGEVRPHILAWRLYTRCSIVHSSICYRRAALSAHGLQYRPEFTYAEDFVLFSEFSDIGGVVILPEELVVYRESASNASSQNTQAMNDNGMRFLRQRYNALLGREIAEQDTATLWKLFNTGLPAADLSELRTAGALYAELLRHFLRKHGYAPRQQAEVEQFAAEDWWRVVARFSQAQGRFDAQRLYTGAEDLSRWKPPLSALSKTYLKSALGRLGLI
ncbi:MAG: glycosyltransferase family A protein [Lamprobacter sp.]|uniref:glycosyltransferase family 2 protein n=1 Tax=Lamprobacter sp. TaxID=3100796 RepID=UPI002B262B1A|nr:glycosyltransferase family A protein [Lamprobacter sp.]MEA3642638.1 glycosyltransferase family A protein [Lamprobacter sp.]